MTNPNRVGLPSRSAKQFRDRGNVTKVFLAAPLAGSFSMHLTLQTIFEPGLKAIADT